MIKDKAKLAEYMVTRALEFGNGCQKVFVAVSGGIDSAAVAAILCRAFGPDNVVGLYRDIRSNPKHLADVKILQSALGFKLIVLDMNPVYDEIVRQCAAQFAAVGLPWADENTAEADSSKIKNAYVSLKSRLTTPLAGFVSKAIDNGRGRIFGTGNGEEDGLLRYFDKYGDGAVDNNILKGLTKAEVRQLAMHFGVPMRIVTKLPTADLEANGDAHNDEDQLTRWARQMGLSVEISYGAPDGSSEGNIAWGWREDINQGVITGENSGKTCAELAALPFNYNQDQIETVLFLRSVEKSSRHKVAPIPGTERGELLGLGLVK